MFNNPATFTFSLFFDQGIDKINGIIEPNFLLALDKRGSQSNSNMGFTIQYTWAEYHEALSLIPADAKGRNDPSRYNVTPGQSFGMVYQRDDETAVRDVMWGLLPFWAKNKKFKPINARGETVAEKPMFREAFKSKRCLIPASSYYEWETVEDKKKLPYNIHLPDNEPFFFAGIWAQNDNLDATTCAIITTAPAIHKMTLQSMS